MGEVGVVGVAHFDRVAVGAGFEDDEFGLGEGFVEIHRDVVKLPEGRHGADFAVGERGLDFGFCRHANRVAEELAEGVEVDAQIGWQDSHDDLAGVEDDDFGVAAAFDTFNGGQFLGGVGDGVVDDLVRDPGLGEVFEEAHRNFAGHGDYQNFQSPV